MIQQVLHRIFRSEKNKVKDMFYDIALFYKYINQNLHKLDELYFQKMFSKRYWVYLNSYPWLTDEKQDYLHQGILNIMLFQIHKHLEENDDLSKATLLVFKKALYSYSPRDKITNDLCNLAKDTILLITLKQQGKHNSNTNGKIYKSITWTLKNKSEQLVGMVRLNH